MNNIVVRKHAKYHLRGWPWISSVFGRNNLFIYLLLLNRAKKAEKKEMWNIQGPCIAYNLSTISLNVHTQTFVPPVMDGLLDKKYKIEFVSPFFFFGSLGPG